MTTPLSRQGGDEDRVCATVPSHAEVPCVWAGYTAVRNGIAARVIGTVRRFGLSLDLGWLDARWTVNVALGGKTGALYEHNVIVPKGPGSTGRRRVTLITRSPDPPTSVRKHSTRALYAAIETLGPNGAATNVTGGAKLVVVTDALNARTFENVTVGDVIRVLLGPKGSEGRRMFVVFGDLSEVSFDDLEAPFVLP